MPRPRLPVDHPLAQRSFDAAEFSLADLRERKQSQHLRIAAVVPTLNEANTVGSVVAVLKRSPLIDRVLVIDSGSTDGTLQVATDFGADTFLASDIRPELGARVGKGENLWKGMVAEPTADIFLFVDADLQDFEDRFVIGLLGPLLCRSDIAYVKGDYERPGGGGRTTELLVRPLFRRFFPELSLLSQPLAGEYAARRHVLEAIPFPVGYGVEAAHLIDISRRFGPEVIGQSYLGERTHRNRSLSELSTMSDTILQTILSRLDLAEPPDSRPAMSGDGRGR